MNMRYDDMPDGTQVWYVSGRKDELADLSSEGWRELFAKQGRKVKILSFEYLTNRRLSWLDPWDTIGYEVKTKKAGGKKGSRKGPEGTIEFKKLTKHPFYKILGGRILPTGQLVIIYSEVKKIERGRKVMGRGKMLCK